jgi:Tol biopolymer transport system component
MALIAICGGIWYSQRQPAATSVNLQAIPLTSYIGNELSPSLSPDGKQIAFSWNGENQNNFDIYVKLVSGGSPQRITNLAAIETAPAWSPDGSQIAFVRMNSDPKQPAQVFVISPFGEAERKVADTVNETSNDWPWIAWAPDGKSIAVLGRESPNESPGIFQVFLETSERRRLTKPPSDSFWGDRMFAFSPDGKRLVFARFSIAQSADLFLLDLPSASEAKRVTTRMRFISGVAWLPGGKDLLFSSPVSAGSYRFGVNFIPDSALWRLTVDAVPAAPQQISGLQGPPGRLSVSGMGQLVYERALHDTNLWFFDTTGNMNTRPDRIAVSTQAEMAPQFSADGQKLAFASDRSGSLEIWVADMQGSAPSRQLTKLNASSHSPRWSPNGGRIVFSSLIENNRDLYLINADGSSLRRLTHDPFEQGRPSFSQDGRFVYHYATPDGGQNIWKIPVEGGPAAQVTTNGGHEAFESPDGSTVYYTKGPFYPDERALFAHRQGGGSDTRVLDGVWDGCWSVTRNGICFVELPKVSGEPPLFVRFWDFRTSRMHQLGSLDRSIVVPNPGFSASWDGRRFALSQIDHINADLMLISKFQ